MIAMKPTSKRITLNRPVFMQRIFDSTAMTVLCTLLHRFSVVGQYDITIRRSGKVQRHFGVAVSSDEGAHQINVDITKSHHEGGECGCAASTSYKLKLGGVMGFYASAGTGKYSVTAVVSNEKEQKKSKLLDSGSEIPAGDLFALTLVRPGVYRAINTKEKQEFEIRVHLPKGQKEYRPDETQVLTLGKKDQGRAGALDIYSGQSVVFHCENPARIRAELIREDESAGQPIHDKTMHYQKPKKPGDSSAQSAR
jgi:hypothetical protein